MSALANLSRHQIEMGNILLNLVLNYTVGLIVFVLSGAQLFII